MATIIPTKSALKRRRLDSCGKRGKVEILEAQPKWLNCLRLKANRRSEKERPYRQSNSLNKRGSNGQNDFYFHKVKNY